MEKRVPWNTGSGDIILSYNNGEGNETVSVSSDVNEGLDRQQTLTIAHDDSLKAELLVTQHGRRERFVLADGKVLVTSGKPFNVLKNGL